MQVRMNPVSSLQAGVSVPLGTPTVGQTTLSMDFKSVIVSEKVLAETSSSETSSSQSADTQCLTVRRVVRHVRRNPEFARVPKTFERYHPPGHHHRLFLQVGCPDHRCDNVKCRNVIGKYEARFHCPRCDFDLCQRCFKIQPDVEVPLSPEDVAGDINDSVLLVEEDKDDPFKSWSATHYQTNYVGCLKRKPDCPGPHTDGCCVQKRKRDAESIADEAAQVGQFIRQQPVQRGDGFECRIIDGRRSGPCTSGFCGTPERH